MATSTSTVTFEDVAEERSLVVRIQGAPNLTDYFGTTIAPRIVWIHYRQVAGQSADFQKADVSGYRAETTGDLERDFTSITLLAGVHDLPAWLAELVTYRTPA